MHRGNTIGKLFRESLAGKPEGKRQHGRPRLIWKADINM